MYYTLVNCSNGTYTLTLYIFDKLLDVDIRSLPPYNLVLIAVCVMWPRYATASARSDGLLLLCGGRDANSVVSFILFVLCRCNFYCGLSQNL
jgi:hypothetical protein